MELFKEFDSLTEQDFLTLRKYYATIERPYADYDFIFIDRQKDKLPLSLTDMVYRIVDSAENIYQEPPSRLTILPSDSTITRAQQHYYIIIANYPNQFRIVLGEDVVIYNQNYKQLVDNSSITILVLFCLEILIISGLIIFLFVSYSKIHNRMIKVLKIFSQLTEDEANELLTHCQMYYNQLIFEAEVVHRGDALSDEDSYSESEDSQLLVQQPVGTLPDANKKRLLKKGKSRAERQRRGGLPPPIPLEENNPSANLPPQIPNNEHPNLKEVQEPPAKQPPPGQQVVQKLTSIKSKTLKNTLDLEQDFKHKDSGPGASNLDIDPQIHPSASFVSVREVSLVDAEVKADHPKKPEPSNALPSSPLKSVENTPSKSIERRLSFHKRSGARKRSKNPRRKDVIA